MLLRAGADPNKPGKDGQTPNYVAAWNGQDRCLELLLAAGTDAHRMDKGWDWLYDECHDEDALAGKLVTHHKHVLGVDFHSIGEKLRCGGKKHESHAQAGGAGGAAGAAGPKRGGCFGGCVGGGSG
jgi:ankyrin repeat protein